MARRYSDDHKKLAMEILESMGGNIAYTSQKTNIPERTLREWRQERQRLLPPPDTRQRRQEVPPAFRDDLEALRYIREQIMEELKHIAANIQDSFAYTTPQQRLHILSGLLDRLVMLDEHLTPYQEPELIRIAWDAGLYIRTPEGRDGPYTPGELTPRWREYFGPEASLEIFWKGDTVTPIPEGEVMDAIFRTVKLTKDDEDTKIDREFDLDDFAHEDDYWRSVKKTMSSPNYWPFDEGVEHT